MTSQRGAGAFRRRINPSLLRSAARSLSCQTYARQADRALYPSSFGLPAAAKANRTVPSVRTA